MTHSLVFILTIAILVLLFYVLLVRPVLKLAPALSPVFKAEATFGQKFHAKMTGLKTKLFSRFLMLGAGFVGVYDQALPLAMGQDWTPLTKRVPDWAIPCGLFAIGFVVSWLRKVTENPHQVITQKMEDGSVQVVAVNPPQA